LHFDTTSTSRDEREHSVLKRRLEFSTDDLKTMIDAINLLLINEYSIYLMKVENDKIRLSMKLNKSIFQNLIAHIITSVLRRIMNQYKLLIEQSTMMFACINIFIDITELSCSHKIQKRLFVEEKFDDRERSFTLKIN
jgi:capsule polysaccharide modification protein KpsS